MIDKADIEKNRAGLQEKTMKFFDIDKRVETDSAMTRESTFNIDDRLISQRKTDEMNSIYERDIYCTSTNLWSPYKARIDCTPRDSEKGHWTGERGESKYVPNNTFAIECLKTFNRDGVEYRNGIPNFSEFNRGMAVQIDNMTSDRINNYRQAYERFAQIWSRQGKDGEYYWTPEAVKKYKQEQNLALHECSDMKTMEMIPLAIHNNFLHSGGRYECSIRDYKEEHFDE